jgi:hypothetical protein
VPQEPALLTSGARMAERSQHRASAGMDAEASVRRRGMGSPEPSPHEVESRAIPQPPIHAGDEPLELPTVGEVLDFEPVPW